MKQLFDESKAQRQYLFSKISVDTLPVSAVWKAKSRLETYPNLVLARDGTALLYVIRQEDGDHFYTLELEKERITLTVYSRNTPASFVQEAVLRLIGIIQMLHPIYDVKLESLYPYLVMALACQQINAVTKSGAKEELTVADVTLSRRIIKLINENENLGRERMLLARALRKTILKTVLSSDASGLKPERIASELGIEKGYVIDALDNAQAEGYRVARAGVGFALVRI